MKTISQVTETLLSGNAASLSEAVSKGEVIASGSRSGLPPQSKSSQRTEQPGAGRTESDIVQFTAALSQACIALKQYGKTPQELRAMRDMFLTVLSDVPVSSLTKALFIHLNQSDEIPTPRQLRDIIHPPKPVWKPDWAVFVSLKKKIHDGYYPLSDESKFLRDCENFALNKRGDEIAEYEQAKLQVQSYTQIGMYD